MPTLVAAEPQLYVRDIAASAAFYSRTLGFSVAFAYGEPPFYAQVVRDGARLNLRQVDDPVVDPVRRDREQLLTASITMADAKPLYREYQEAGAEIVQSLQAAPWGAQTFIVRDPDGISSSSLGTRNKWVHRGNRDPDQFLHAGGSCGRKGRAGGMHGIIRRYRDRHPFGADAQHVGRVDVHDGRAA